MISLMFALLAGPALVGPQAVQAEFQACALEGGRYVCRYVVPDIVIVPVPGTNITADAPASVLGSASSADGVATAPPTAVPALPLEAAPITTPPATAPVAVTADPGPIRPIDTGVLTEREARLVSRCADAGWMSLCLPDDRRAARSLSDKQDAYLAVRREVTRLLSEDRCDAAVKAALDGGYLGLARETRDYCATPTTASSAGAGSAPVSSNAEVEDTSEN